MSDQSRVAAFVTKNVDFYASKWAIPEGHSAPPASFNAAALFAGIFWLAYRKLYTVLFLLIAILAADISLSVYIEESSAAGRKLIAVWDLVSPFVYASVIGVFGNSWYWRKFRKHEEEARNISPDPATQEAHLRAHGGTSMLSVWALIVFVVGFVVLAVAYLEPAV